VLLFLERVKKKILFFLLNKMAIPVVPVFLDENTNLKSLWIYRNYITKNEKERQDEEDKIRSETLKKKFKKFCIERTLSFIQRISKEPKNEFSFTVRQFIGKSFSSPNPVRMFISSSVGVLGSRTFQQTNRFAM